MDVSIVLGIAGLFLTVAVGYIFYRLAERKTEQRMREAQQQETERAVRAERQRAQDALERKQREEKQEAAEKQRQALIEQERADRLRDQQLDRDRSRRDSARSQFLAKPHDFDARVYHDGERITVKNLSDEDLENVVMFTDDGDNGYSAFVFGRLAVLPAQGWADFGHARTFNYVDEIVITGYRKGSSQPMTFEVPLDPYETMPEFRRGGLSDYRIIA